MAEGVAKVPLGRDYCCQYSKTPFYDIAHVLVRSKKDMKDVTFKLTNFDRGKAPCTGKYVLHTIDVVVPFLKQLPIATVTPTYVCQVQKSYNCEQ